VSGTVPVSQVLGLIAVEREDGASVLRMAGEIDAEAVAVYEAQHVASEAPGISLVDLTEVTYLSSAGLGLLLRETRAARERGDIPTCRGISRPAGRILRLAGVANLFRIAHRTPVPACPLA
jgi:anti-anti-sigma factor